MRGLAYPLTYDGDGKPSVNAFTIQLSEARGVATAVPGESAYGKAKPLIVPDW